MAMFLESQKGALYCCKFRKVADYQTVYLVRTYYQRRQPCWSRTDRKILPVRVLDKFLNWWIKTYSKPGHTGFNGPRSQFVGQILLKRPSKGRKMGPKRQNILPAQVLQKGVLPVEVPVKNSWGTVHIKNSNELTFPKMMFPLPLVMRGSPLVSPELSFVFAESRAEQAIGSVEEKARHLHLLSIITM